MTDLPKLHVAVLMGGWANERPVSLMSGEGVAKALEERGHKVTRIDMDRQVAARIAETAPDVVFNALHGRWAYSRKIVDSFVERPGLQSASADIAIWLFVVVVTSSPTHRSVPASSYARVCQCLTGKSPVVAV